MKDPPLDALQAASEQTSLIATSAYPTQEAREVGQLVLISSSFHLYSLYCFKYRALPMRVLLIEDDPKITRALVKTLRAEGYAVDTAPDGIAGEELAKVNDNDIILLDLMLPRQDGWTTCANLRKANIKTPILMLTALDDVDDKIAGLDVGADDYLAKPFHTGELLARMRSLTRRPTSERSAVVERYGVILDSSTRRTLRDGKEINLTAREFALLELLLIHAEMIVTRTMIIEHLWDMNFEPRSNVIEAFVKFLRQKIDQGFEPPLIHTVRGSGYIFSDRPPR
jgi:two-component system copper resistance phosphate regulon response regulator CusR